MVDQQIRVLLVTESEDDDTLIVRELRRGGFEPYCERVETAQAFITALEREVWDLILAAYSLPRFSALEALELLHDSGIDLPFIVVSEPVGEDIAVLAMKAGAHDFVTKDHLRRLIPAVERELRDASERRARRTAEETLKYQAYHDVLTGLPNRALFLDRLGQAMAYLHRDARRLAVLFLDLDRFKSINDTLGHGVGDEVLRMIAERLANAVRQEDTVARLGGDEFAILLTLIDDRSDADAKANELLALVQRPLKTHARELHVGGSIGIALFPEDAQQPDTLLRNADIAMYEAKAKGGDRYVTFTPAIVDSASARFTLENSLRRALRQQELRLVYQPQVNLKSGKVSGVEALVRWQNPELGLLTPEHFIPLAENTGLVEQIGQWVLHQACDDYIRWHQQGWSPPRLAINLSARCLVRMELLNDIREMKSRCALALDVLEFEITESGLMSEPELAAEMIHALRAMGVRVAIDDFGVGYSSLAYLRRFAVSTIKIDRSFVYDVPAHRDAVTIVNAIIALAHGLNLRVIAEGVETKAQQNFFREHDCEEMQGFLFSQPMPANEIPAFLSHAQAKVKPLGEHA